MNSKRLIAIANLVEKNSKVIDIGTDHAYVPIILYKNNITSNILATDISKRACLNAKNNLKRNNIENIDVIESDGFENIHGNYDVAILSGMGTRTILKILETNNLPDKLIISSQNDYGTLRKELNKKGYKIVKEIVIYEKKYYPIIKYEKGNEKLSQEEILFGKSKNINYYNYLSKKYNKLYNQSKTEKFLNYQNLLSKIIEKI